MIAIANYYHYRLIMALLYLNYISISSSANLSQLSIVISYHILLLCLTDFVTTKAMLSFRLTDLALGWSKTHVCWLKKLLVGYVILLSLQNPLLLSKPQDSLWLIPRCFVQSPCQFTQDFCSIHIFSHIKFVLQKTPRPNPSL